MPDTKYSTEELQRYFSDPAARRGGARNGAQPSGPDHSKNRLRRYFYDRFSDPKKAQAGYVLSLLVGVVLLGVLVLGIYTLTLVDDLPSFKALDNPQLQLATVAYTADGKELARYAYQNRSWVTFDQISPHVINALVATEDRRFYQHWGVDARGIASAVIDALMLNPRGASTISQQLARNLYNKEIGREVTVSRKLKEIITAVQLERRYTKREIIEMYLNTVEYVYRAFGIEAAAHTFFNKPVSDLNVLESATLVGMLRNPSLYNPIRFPENAKRRRNQVLQQMVKYGYLDSAFYAEHSDDPVETDFTNTAEITASFAPYFAEYVRNWLQDWRKDSGIDFYSEGLSVYTTLDSRLQELAQETVRDQMKGLQTVVDYEWSRPSPGLYASSIEPYEKASGYDPFAYFWRSRRELVDSFIRETAHYRHLRDGGTSATEALSQLKDDEAFMDSLKTEKTRLEAGLVSIDPRNGYVKAWVGGRNLADDWFDHVVKAKRQPGSTFKPFVYTVAISNGYSPWYTLPDCTLTYPLADGSVWRPSNSGGEASDQYMTLRDALAMSKNLVTARLMREVKPQNVAFMARRMGIKSELDEVPALALGVSDVTLLEMTSAYTTFASGGLHYEPVVVTRIENRFGNVLYEATPAPSEAISEETAYTMIDMLRGSIQHPQGTAVRIRFQFNLGDYDLAAKTGTTQNSADGWFMLMHPELVTGAWVGFNDRRVTFRTNFWGQGAHNAQFLVGGTFRKAADAGLVSKERFPMPQDFGVNYARPDSLRGADENRRGRDRRVGW